MSEEQKYFEVGVQHTQAGKIYTFITEEQSLKTGDYVVIEEEEGLTALAEVVNAPVPAHSIEGRKKIIRKATKEDKLKDEEMADRAKDLLDFCKDRVRERELPMKIVGARFYEPAKKLVFFFVSDGRVDFRSLVKELAQTLKLRIELRQIGARDGSKIIGCVGPCGRTTCCSTYLRHFQSISVGMAKNQSLSPNPTKLTGMCNKLKCGLAYEDKLYCEMRKTLPEIGDTVKTEAGDGYVIELRIPTQKVLVELPEQQRKWFAVAEVEVTSSRRRPPCGKCCDAKEEKKEEPKFEDNNKVEPKKEESVKDDEKGVPLKT